MKSRVFVLILILGLLGWLGLFVIQWQFGLGRFATSPQRFALRPGGRAIVGGGRAVLGLVALRKREVLLEMRCAAETKRLELGEEQVSEQVCGVKVRWLKDASRFEALRDRAHFEASWDR